jgi:hypothetical protein
MHSRTNGKTGGEALWTSIRAGDPCSTTLPQPSHSHSSQASCEARPISNERPLSDVELVVATVAHWPVYACDGTAQKAVFESGKRIAGTPFHVDFATVRASH